MRLVAIGAAAGLVLTVAACTAAKPTTIYLPATPSPTPTPTATIEVVTPSPSPTGTPTAASATPTGSVAPTPTPTPTPAGAAAGCSGSDANKAWWAAESKKLTFEVYCGVVSGSWYFNQADDTYGGGGTMIASYKGPSSALFTIKEGAFCTSGASACSPHDTYVGPAKFGDLDGALYTLGPGLGYAIYIGAGTTHGYTATGTNMSQATFVNLAKALIKVPKS
jgi:hypothetical protein